MFAEDIAGAIETGGIGRQMQDKDAEISQQRRIQEIEFKRRASLSHPTHIHLILHWLTAPIPNRRATVVRPTPTGLWTRWSLT